MDRLELLVATAQRHLLRALDKSARPLGVFLDIQVQLSFCRAARPEVGTLRSLEALIDETPARRHVSMTSIKI